MIRGLRERLGPQEMVPDYWLSLEAAIWHCLRLRGVARPTPANLTNPLAPHSSHLFGPYELGIDMCENDSQFMRGYLLPSTQAALRCAAESIVECESTSSRRSRRSTTLLEGHAVYPTDLVTSLQEQRGEFSRIHKVGCALCEDWCASCPPGCSAGDPTKGNPS
jgi:hypothetical protein